MSREYSENTQQYIDTEITEIINSRYKHVVEMLSAKKELIEKIALRLLEVETVAAVEFNSFVDDYR